MGITDEKFKVQAGKIKNTILEIVISQARHPAIWKIQDILREKADRLYYWADYRSIPADNNQAERELCPLVIARKVSFGSQSDAGARTRETFMMVLHTVGKRTSDVMTAFKSILDKLFEQADLARALLTSIHPNQAYSSRSARYDSQSLFRHFLCLHLTDTD